MLSKRNKKVSLRFRRWSRKSYAAFQSIGKHVTIGNVKNIVADTFLGKQKNTTSFQDFIKVDNKENKDEISDPQDVMMELAFLLLPIVPKKNCYKKESLNSLYIQNTWLMALLLSAIFILNPNKN